MDGIGKLNGILRIADFRATEIDKIDSNAIFSKLTVGCAKTDTSIQQNSRKKRKISEINFFV